MILYTEESSRPLKSNISHHKGDIGHKKLILATEEVITAILKVISATTKAIDSPVLLLEANSKYVLNIIIIGIGGA